LRRVKSGGQKRAGGCGYREDCDAQCISLVVDSRKLYVRSALALCRRTKGPDRHLILATINGLVGVDKMKAGFKKQAIWNSYAALATAAAALLQAAAMMTE
jgi:hypothetical protein